MGTTCINFAGPLPPPGPTLDFGVLGLPEGYFDGGNSTTGAGFLFLGLPFLPPELSPPGLGVGPAPGLAMTAGLIFLAWATGLEVAIGAGLAVTFVVGFTAVLGLEMASFFAEGADLALLML